MSKVYSFRLDEKNPREAKAKEVIDAWSAQGYSLRNIITDSLINSLSNTNQPREIGSLLEQLLEKINQLDHSALPEARKEENPSIQVKFVESIRRSVKPGLTK